ncbi:unnamed protein product [Vicia faba]|uniref:Uncharacterized protein n=1 Tax=Vicia faba TaxID=3906 RepID=A0AAV0YWW3_VICFA|nr:unnamed protein product [Vicia faba]
MLREKFLKPFSNHNLLKFIGLSKKFNPDYVKAFYCNLELTTTGLKSKFKDCAVKFRYCDFTKLYWLTSSSSSVTAARLSQYDTVHFVLSISKFVTENIVMSNFPISQVMFNM